GRGSPRNPGASSRKGDRTMRTCWLGMGALLLALLPAPAPAAPTRDAASPLAQVPASAQVVVHLRGVEHTRDRLLTLLQNAVATPVRELVVALKRNQPGLETKLTGPLADRLLGTDVGLYVDLAAVNKTYGAQIAEFSKGVQQSLNQAPGGLGSNKASLEAIK